MATRLSVTRNAPKEKLQVGVVTESLKHAHLPENIACLSPCDDASWDLQSIALVPGTGSLWIFVSADNKTDCIRVGIGRVTHKKGQNYVHVGEGSNEPGWIHGRTVTDGWTGAPMQKLLAIH